MPSKNDFNIKNMQKTVRNSLEIVRGAQSQSERYIS